MDRKPLGIAVIAAAALALLIVNKVNGRDAPGTAIQAPPLPVPAAGACIAVPAASSTIPCGVIEVAEFPAAGNWAIPPITIVSFPISTNGPIGWTGCVTEPYTTVGADTCAVHAAVGGTLVGSVAGLGSKPIPYD